MRSSPLSVAPPPPAVVVAAADVRKTQITSNDDARSLVLKMERVFAESCWRLLSLQLGDVVSVGRSCFELKTR